MLETSRMIEMATPLKGAHQRVDTSCTEFSPTDREIPESFLCPISVEVMEDPVLIVETKQTLSWTSAAQWFSTGVRRCPITNIKLSQARMVPNLALASAIQEWKLHEEPKIGTSFLCPVMKCVMEDPVLLVGSKTTVSRAAVEQWLTSNVDQCPVTNIHVKNKEVVPNLALKNALEELRNMGDHTMGDLTQSQQQTGAQSTGPDFCICVRETNQWMQENKTVVPIRVHGGQVGKWRQKLLYGLFYVSIVVVLTCLIYSTVVLIAKVKA